MSWEKWGRMSIDLRRLVVPVTVRRITRSSVSGVWNHDFASPRQTFPRKNIRVYVSAEDARLRAAESIGRPLGDRAFVARLERATKWTLRPRKRGLKRRPQDDDRQGRLI